MKTRTSKAKTSRANAKDIERLRRWTDKKRKDPEYRAKIAENRRRAIAETMLYANIGKMFCATLDTLAELSAKKRALDANERKRT